MLANDSRGSIDLKPCSGCNETAASKPTSTASTTRYQQPTTTSVVSSGSCGGATTHYAGPRWRSDRRSTWHRRHRHQRHRYPPHRISASSPTSWTRQTTWPKILKHLNDSSCGFLNRLLLATNRYKCRRSFRILAVASCFCYIWVYLIAI